jgi:V8-like Glu-specific endopeptidase
MAKTCLRAAARVNYLQEDRMRGGICRPHAAVRLAVVLAMHRAAWFASLMLTAIGAYVVAPAALAAGQPDASGGIPIHGKDAIGALFTSSNGKLGAHFCTASVVSSPAGNLLITAAHCMQGRSLRPAGSIVFAPGYHNGRFPHGIWVVTTEYVDAAWSKYQNPDDDVAFLVAGLQGTHIQRHTGAEALKIDEPAQVVQVIGYPDQTDDPITCTAPAREFDAHEMVFDCNNYTNGTSGGPFLADVNAKTGEGWLIGVIGGYENGGDTPNVSYSPRFFSAILALYQTAISGGPGTAISADPGSTVASGSQRSGSA